LATHFLRVGFVRDQLEEIERGIVEIRRKLEVLGHLPGSGGDGGAGLPDSGGRREVLRRLRFVLSDVARRCREAGDFLDSLPSEPLIYTGRGSTDEVIEMLEGLLSERDSRLPAEGGTKGEGRAAHG